ncbi:diguanylate cyclase [Halopseudomonas sp.]|uniref:diguanylate cyclase n=1 Tax=Halopseudomonas sp. TaxID=2901191 RepID=UPI0039E2F3FD
MVKPINPVIVKARVKTQLTLKRQNDTLRSVALLDGLTGVANRRMFDEKLERDWRQCKREKEVLSVIMIDVDHFKRYNDRYGHLQGDTCLRSLANTLDEVINRPYDLLARYGGEEFACLLPNTHLDGGVQIAERMLECVETLEIEHLDSDTRQIVTISIGVAAMIPSNEATPLGLLAEADTQLYKAKQAGRACISFSV